MCVSFLLGFFCSEFDGLFLDYSRQCATVDTMSKLFSLAEVSLYYISEWLYWLTEKTKKKVALFLIIFFVMQAAHLKEKINSMFSGEHVSEDINYMFFSATCFPYMVVFVFIFMLPS